MKLSVHPSLAPRLAALKQTLPHAILLSGPLGVGLEMIAHDLADQAALLIEPTDKDGVPSPHGSIPVEPIRRLYTDTRSKHARMVVVIKDADALTPAAQGAFLKLLEEPPVGTHFILTSHRPARLLSTVLSRLQEYKVPPITPEQTDDIITHLPKLSVEQRAQLRFLAHGRPTLIYQYAEHPERLAAAGAVVRDARTVLSAPRRYDRLVAALAYANRTKALELLDACITLSRYSLRSAASPAAVAELDRLVTAHDAIARNHNPRLQLLALITQ